MKIKVENVLPNPDQPRTIFDESELQGLAQSIKENGVIQPIVVEDAGKGEFIIVDGERRLRATKLAGITEIEAVIRPASNHKGSDRFTHALVANIQRAQMGFVDEAKAYQRLINELGTVEAVAKKTGMSTATISGRISLLDLSPTTQKMYNLRKLPFDLSVIALLKRLSHEKQDQLVSMAITRGWKTTSFLRAGTNMLKNGNVDYMRRKRKEKVIEVDGHFDALAMIKNKLPTPIKNAAQATCRNCPLYAEASMVVCKQCPLPEFLSKVNMDGKA